MKRDINRLVRWPMPCLVMEVFLHSLRLKYATVPAREVLGPGFWEATEEAFGESLKYATVSPPNTIVFQRKGPGLWEAETEVGLYVFDEEDGEVRFRDPQHGWSEVARTTHMRTAQKQALSHLYGLLQDREMGRGWIVPPTWKAPSGKAASQVSFKEAEPGVWEAETAEGAYVFFADEAGEIHYKDPKRGWYEIGRASDLNSAKRKVQQHLVSLKW